MDRNQCHNASQNWPKQQPITRSTKCPSLYTKEATSDAYIFPNVEKPIWPKCQSSGASLRSQNSVTSESSCTDKDEASENLKYAFAESTTLHGIAQWYGPRHAKGWKKCAYFLIWLIFTGIMFFQLHANIHNFLLFETRISFKHANAESLKFPSITICQESTFRKSAIGGSPLALAAFSQFNVISQYKNIDTCYDPSLSESATRFCTMEKLAAFVEKLQEREATRFFAVPMEDQFLRCAFKEEEFNCSESWFSHNTQYGLCHTFNYANTLTTSPRSVILYSDNYRRRTREVQGSGTFSSLRLLLSEEKNESCLLASGRSTGFIIDIHDTTAMPIMPEMNIAVAAGTRNQIALHEKRRNRGALEHHGTCTKDYPLYLYPGVPYARGNCIMQCLTEDIWQGCHCINAYIVLDLEDTATKLNENYHAHNLTDLQVCFFGGKFQCMWPIIERYLKHGTSRCLSVCPEACYETTYEAEVSTVPFPADQVVPHMINITKFKTEKEVKENLVDVEIFFQTMQYEESVETDAISISDLFSNIGGTLGLYLGASFLTLVEVVDFFISWLVLVCRKVE